MEENDHDEIIEVEDMSNSPTNWNVDTEHMLQTWMKDYNKCYQKHKTHGRRCRWTHKILLMIVIIASTVSGSNGLLINGKISDSSGMVDTYGMIQSIIMISIGAITMMLQYIKLEKIGYRQKTLSSSYKTLAKKIEIQMSLPRETRQNFLIFVDKIEKKRQSLEKCYAINIRPSISPSLSAGKLDY